MREKKQQNETEIMPAYSCDLRHVIEKDYWATQMLIHEIYIPGFNPNQFVELVEGLKWLKETKDETLKETIVSGADMPGLPRFARNFRSTIKIFFEKERELKNGKNNLLAGIPVAYSAGEREKLTKDLENSTYNEWLEFRNNPELKTGDDICGEVFRAYWKKLQRRAIILKLKGEPSDSK